MKNTVFRRLILAAGIGVITWQGLVSCSSPQDHDPETQFKMMSPKPLSQNTDSIEVWVEYGDKSALLYSGNKSDEGFNGPYIKTVDDYNGEDLNLIIKEFNSGGEVISEQQTPYVVEGGDIVNDIVLTLWPDSLVLYPGSDTILNAAVFPNSYEVFWSSSDSSVVTVSDSGLVQAAGMGSAEVTAALKSDSSISKTAVITVISNPAALEAIDITRDTLKLVAGGNTGALQYTVSPDSITAEVTWSSGDASIAIVSSAGQVSPVSAGEAFIYARAVINQAVYDSVVIVVSGPLNPDSVGAVTGRVLAPIVSAPLPNVPVTLNGLSDNTNISGEYFFSDLTPGTYNLSLGGTDYTLVEVGNVVVTAGDTTVVLDVTMQTAPVNPPVADAGNDTTVIVNQPINLHAAGTDDNGTIEKMEWKINDGQFMTASRQDTSFFAPAEPMVYTCILRITDNDGETGLDTVVVTVVYSPDNSLSSLEISAGELDPVFNPAHLLYTVQAASEDTLITITPTAGDINSGITVNGTAVNSGEATDPMGIPIEGIQVDIQVTAQDSSVRTYQLNITRNASTDAALSDLTVDLSAMSPEFNPDSLFYTLTLEHAVSSITVTPTANSSRAVIQLESTEVPSGQPVDYYGFSVGKDTLDIEVTAEDGTTSKLYQLEVIRPGLLYVNHYLDQTLAPYDTLEVPVDLSYEVTTDPLFGFTFQNWTVTSGALTISDTGSISTSINLFSDTAAIQANFTVSEYTLSIDTAGGILAAPVGPVTVIHGTKTAINTTEGPWKFHFDHWEAVTGSATFDDSLLKGTNVTLTQGDAVITPVYAPDSFVISIRVDSLNPEMYENLVCVNGNCSQFYEVQAVYYMGDSLTVEAQEPRCIVQGPVFCPEKCFAYWSYNSIEYGARLDTSHVLTVSTWTNWSFSASYEDCP
ncbi:cadherin-like beta sandwich domain-containing protein [Fibrobacterota bacterium]